MKILGIVGSMKKDGHTDALVRGVIEEVRRVEPGASSDIIHITERKVGPCRVVCNHYCTTNPYKCALPDDLGGMLSRMTEAEALVIGAPLYFRGPPAAFQAFAERLVSLFFFHESRGDCRDPSPLADKPCGLVGVAEYSNPHQILEYLADFCATLKMNPILLSRFPYLGVASQGDRARDAVFNPRERSRELAEALTRNVREKKSACAGR